MQLLPNLKPGLLNGWILVATLFGSFGILLAAFPRRVVARLYDRSHQEERRTLQRIFGVLLFLVWLGPSILTPLRLGHVVLPLGLALYTLGLAGPRRSAGIWRVCWRRSGGRARRERFEKSPPPMRRWANRQPQGTRTTFVFGQVALAMGTPTRKSPLDVPARL